MGVTNALYNYGFEYSNPAKPYDLKGFVNSKEAAAGLEYYKELYDTATPPVPQIGTWVKTSMPTSLVRSRFK